MAVAADSEPGGKLLKDGDLEFRTKSVEEALAPLIEQVQTFRCTVCSMPTFIKP